MDAKEKARFISSVSVESKTDCSQNHIRQKTETAASCKPAEDANDIFALGLPEWDLVPPQILVRRFKRV